jgi:hypothetical protein
MNPFGQLSQAFHQHLAPEGPLEETLVDEIIRAAWRLRHCEEADDKSRNFAHRILRNCVADLRRLQTTRQIREVLDPEAIHTGIASYRELLAARKSQATLEKENWVRSAQADSATPPPSHEPAADPHEAGSSQINPVGRNALCPCGSREKFKRCCGKNAPPVLNQTQAMPKAA